MRRFQYLVLLSSSTQAYKTFFFRARKEQGRAQKKNTLSHKEGAGKHTTVRARIANSSKDIARCW